MNDLFYLFPCNCCFVNIWGLSFKSIIFSPRTVKRDFLFIFVSVILGLTFCLYLFKSKSGFDFGFCVLWIYGTFNYFEYIFVTIEMYLNFDIYNCSTMMEPIDKRNYHCTAHLNTNTNKMNCIWNGFASVSTSHKSFKFLFHIDTLLYFASITTTKIG